MIIKKLRNLLAVLPDDYNLEFFNKHFTKFRYFMLGATLFFLKKRSSMNGLYFYSLLFCLLIFYHVSIFVPQLVDKYFTSQKTIQNLETRLQLTENYKKAIDIIKANRPYLGGALIDIHGKILNNDLDGVKDSIDQLPRTNHEIMVAERVLINGLNLYKWYVKELGSPVASVDQSFVSSEYGYIYEKMVQHYRWHYAIDIVVRFDYSALAAGDGTVVKVVEKDLIYGNYVHVEHLIKGEHYRTCYAHLDRISVDLNQKVKMGDILGIIGNTGRSDGDHLHFEVWEFIKGVGWRTLPPVINSTYGRSVSLQRFVPSMW